MENAAGKTGWRNRPTIHPAGFHSTVTIDAPSTRLHSLGLEFRRNARGFQRVPPPLDSVTRQPLFLNSTRRAGPTFRLSGPRAYLMPKWRNWQTRMVQVHVGAIPWKFESSLGHSGTLSPVAGDIVRGACRYGGIPFSG